MLTQLKEDEVIPQLLPAENAALGRKVLTYFIYIFLFFVVLAVFVPLNPLMPAHGLDTSWMFAMNQGVARHLVFGKDIVFTFGPYSSIYTELYDPATDHRMVFGSLFLGLCYGLSLLLLAKGKNKYGLLLFAIFLAGFSDSRDALLFSYPLILSLVAYRITLPAGHEWKLELGSSSTYAAAMLFAPLGLLPLIKSSLLPMCGVIALFCLAIFWANGKKMLSLAAVGIPAISCAFFWGISGQPFQALPGFFLCVRQIIAGYNEAMSFPGDSIECVLYILAAAILLLVIVSVARAPRPSTIFLFMTYAFFLFLAFKAGFIRHDSWHNITAGTSLLAAALLLIFVINAKPSILPIAAALLVWLYIGHGTVPSTSRDIALNARDTFAQSVRGMRARLANPGALQTQYADHLASIKAAFPVPLLPGTMDIYSFNQSWVLASGNIWNPRPVTQSYSAYTPELAELNRSHLEGSGAPDNILFRVEPIDGRLPSMEDGASWPVLLDRYSFQKLDRDTAYLRKRTDSAEYGSPADADFYTATEKFGQEVPLPESSDPIFARVEIAPTFTGRLWSALYKPPELHIAMRTPDGKLTNYRIISGMIKTDFLISPLVKSTEDFVLLAAGGNKYLTRNKVKSISIFSDGSPGLLWNTTYTLHLGKVNILKNSDAENSRIFEKQWSGRMDSPADSKGGNPATQACEGAIESVNGVVPHYGIPPVGNALSIKGWLAISGKNGIVPEQSYVTLTGGSGQKFYFTTHSIPHEDIRGHFHQPTMPDPGYAAILDVSNLSGPYTLGLARTYQETTQTCSQFSVPVQIAH